MRQLPLYRRGGRPPTFTLVDDSEYERLAESQWHTVRGGYVARTVKRNGRTTTELMHRVLLGLDIGDPREGDHINRNPLDNRRENLRITDRSGSCQNRSGWGESGFKGVTRNGKGWRARARVNGVLHHLGTFPTPEKAAAAALSFRRQHLPFAGD